MSDRRASSPDSILVSSAIRVEPCPLRLETGHPSNNVTALHGGGRALYLVGTAHVSQSSAQEVRQLIERLRPDTVCVELDTARYEALVDEARWRKLDIFEIIKQRKVVFLAASVLLTAYQRRLARQLGVRPGADMLAAIEASGAVGARLVLADRDIQATLKRTWARLSIATKAKLLAAAIEGLLTSHRITEQQVEQLKDRDNISAILEQLARLMPEVKEPLIDERDQYLMARVEASPGQTVVAVVGAGHVPGMVRHAGKAVDLDKLSSIPPPSALSRALKWLIPAVVLAAFYYGYRQHNGADLREMLWAWVLPNSVLAALLTAAGGGKLLTVLASFVASPITSLNPTISAGMVAGLVEAYLRRPTVEDFERVNDDMTSIRGLYRNRFTRVLVVAVLATVGSALGAWVGATWVVTLV